MKYITLLLIIFVSSNAYSGELKKQYLSPEASVFSGLTILTDYHAYLVKVFSKAYKAEDGCKVNIRVVVTPSFSPEYVIGVKEKNDKYYAFKLTTKDHIWHEFNKAYQSNLLGTFLHKSFVITETHAEISAEIYQAIEKPCSTMLREARFQKPDGLDGVTYHFSDNQMASASCWSPDSDSQPAYLVKIFELLGQYTDTNEKNGIEKAIIKVAVSLNESLKKLS